MHEDRLVVKHHSLTVYCGMQCTGPKPKLQELYGLDPANRLSTLLDGALPRGGASPARSGGGDPRVRKKPRAVEGLGAGGGEGAEGDSEYGLRGELNSRDPPHDVEPIEGHA